MQINAYLSNASLNWQTEIKEKNTNLKTRLLTLSARHFDLPTFREWYRYRQILVHFNLLALTVLSQPLIRTRALNVGERKRALSELLWTRYVTAFEVNCGHMLTYFMLTISASGNHIEVYWVRTKLNILTMKWTWVRVQGHGNLFVFLFCLVVPITPYETSCKFIQTHSLLIKKWRPKFKSIQS